PLVLRVLVVVGADLLARRQLVHGRARLLGSELLAEAEQADAETLGILVLIFELGSGDVDLAHGCHPARSDSKVGSFGLRGGRTSRQVQSFGALSSRNRSSREAWQTRVLC